MEQQRSSRFAGAIAIVALLLGTLAAAPGHAASSREKAADIQRLLAAYHDLDLFMGTALVAENGDVIHKSGHGMANVEWGIANRPDHRFRIG